MSVYVVAALGEVEEGWAEGDMLGFGETLELLLDRGFLELPACKIREKE